MIINHIVKIGKCKTKMNWTTSSTMNSSTVISSRISTMNSSSTVISSSMNSSSTVISSTVNSRNYSSNSSGNSNFIPGKMIIGMCLKCGLLLWSALLDIYLSYLWLYYILCICHILPYYTDI